MNYRTLSDMAALIRANIQRIPRVGVVVGIPRSGMIAASMIATLTNQELRTVNQMGDDEVHYLSILLVDDTIAGGTTMRHNLERLIAWQPHATITTLAVYAKVISPRPDIWFEEVQGPRVFEWNWHRSKYLTTAMLDIDGVISTETMPGHRNGELLYRPDRKVLALATGRRENERSVTEEFLSKHRVEYGSLFMSNVTHLDQRARDTKFKACQAVRPKWIIESNIHQADWLHARTGLPVLCTDANRMLT